MSRHVIGDDRKPTKQNLLNCVVDVDARTDCSMNARNFRIHARNCVNDRQGYRTVKMVAASKRFPPKWIPVRVKKTRQNRKLL
jgi:hypothetical protein